VLAILGGWLDDHPPTDDAGLLEFARGLPVPDAYEALKNLEPIGPVHTFKFSSNLRHHYERMKRFPEGLAVLGDALCSFNPAYGQGITTAAKAASVLGECLDKQARLRPRGDMIGLAQRFRKAVTPFIDNPWMLATNEDFRYPEVEGKRPFGLGPLNKYIGKVHKLVATDPEVHQTFLRVLNLVEPPTALLSPKMAWRVLTSRVKEAGLEATGPTAPLPSPTRAG
jgi:hypothetical protein